MRIAQVAEIYRLWAASRCGLFRVCFPDNSPERRLIVFPFEDDYSFGILQSGIHWVWLTNRCSTLTGRYRYTSNTVFDSFPWPQTPKAGNVERVCCASVALRALRRDLREKHGMSLGTYRTLELPRRVTPEGRACSPGQRRERRLWDGQVGRRARVFAGTERFSCYKRRWRRFRRRSRAPACGEGKQEGGDRRLPVHADCSQSLAPIIRAPTSRRSACTRGGSAPQLSGGAESSRKTTSLYFSAPLCIGDVSLPGQEWIGKLWV